MLGWQVSVQMNNVLVWGLVLQQEHVACGLRMRTAYICTRAQHMKCTILMFNALRTKVEFDSAALLPPDTYYVSCVGVLVVCCCLAVLCVQAVQPACCSCACTVHTA
jgi:hypothetical protein